MKLKSLLLGLGLLALAAGTACAQTFDLGVEAGANFSTLVGSDVNNLGSSNALSSKLGFVGGGFLCLNFGTSFGIRPEVLYEQKGSAYSGTSSTTELDYIEVPVLLKFGLGTPVFNPAILLGPSFSWNTVAQSVNNGNTNTITNSNGSDVGVVGGLEIDIDKFLLSGRYELGLDNVTQNKNVQNGTLTFLLGYSFM